MLITKRSLLTKKENTLEIDVTQAQLDEWEGGALIQNVMPHLSRDDREFLISGITPDAWEDTFGSSDE
jgi:hypothetical protein